MSNRTRKIFLFLTLAGVVALAVFAPPLDPPAMHAPAVGGSGSTKTNVPTAVRALEKDARTSVLLQEFPERNILGKAKDNPFDSQSWQPPPPKVAVSPAGPPPPPPPPPMTYRFAGRLAQDGRLQIFVSNGDTPMVAKPGDNLGGYVIESIGASAIALVHPATGHRESIFIPPVGTGEGAAQVPGAAVPTFRGGAGAPLARGEGGASFTPPAQAQSVAPVPNSQPSGGPTRPSSAK